jgi:hypothetical protein
VEAERRSVIALTESELIAANFAALGIANESKASTPDRVLAAYKDFIEEHKRIPTAVEIATAIGISVSSVRSACRELAQADRMLRFIGASGQWAYMPRVVPE